MYSTFIDRFIMVTTQIIFNVKVIIDIIQYTYLKNSKMNNNAFKTHNRVRQDMISKLFIANTLT